MDATEIATVKVSAGEHHVFDFGHISSGNVIRELAKALKSNIFIFGTIVARPRATRNATDIRQQGQIMREQQKVMKMPLDKETLTQSGMDRRIERSWLERNRKYGWLGGLIGLVVAGMFWLWPEAGAR
ncbi:MAG: hypothetical protein ACE5EM_11415 [Sphingomonadales bacterium]